MDASKKSEKRNQKHDAKAEKNNTKAQRYDTKSVPLEVFGRSSPEKRRLFGTPSVNSLDLESSEFVVWDSFMATFLCWMHLRSANVRGPVPNVRCKSRHDLEIRGRFSASSDGHVDVMGKVGREALERNGFAWFLISMVFQTFFSNGWRYLEGQCSFHKSMIFGVVGVVGYESSLNGITFWASFSPVPRSEIPCF